MGHYDDLRAQDAKERHERQLKEGIVQRRLELQKKLCDTFDCTPEELKEIRKFLDNL